MAARAGIAVVLLLAGVATPDRASAEENPLASLTGVGSHLRRGWTAFLAGKDPAEAFAPWTVLAPTQDVADLRTALGRHHVARATEHLGVDLDLYDTHANGEVSWTVVRVLVTSSSAALLRVTGPRAETGVPPDAIDLAGDAAGSPSPFAAAKAVDLSLRTTQGDAIPLVSTETLKALVGEGSAEAWTRETPGMRDEVRRVASERARRAPKRVHVRVTAASVFEDKSGKPAALVGGAFSRTEDRLVGYSPGEVGELKPRVDDNAAKTRAAAREVRTALIVFYAENRRLPERLEELLSPREFLSELPEDAWGRPLRYVVTERREFEIRSLGPDGVEGNGDDVVVTRTDDADEEEEDD
jgi:hypothetical protein